MARWITLVLLVACGVAAPSRAAALDARVTEIRMAGGTLRAAIEIRDMFPARFQSVLEQGGAIHLRLQVELWEHRAIWDRLAQPALITIFRIIMDPATRLVSVADQYGEVSRQPAWQEPLTLRLDIGRTEAVVDAKHYYVRIASTLGTIAERDTASNAVFGEDDGSVGLGSMGRAVFRAVLEISDYLQSVSADARTRDVTGKEMKVGVGIR
jgi:hypothetical protein